MDKTIEMMGLYDKINDFSKKQKASGELLMVLANFDIRNFNVLLETINSHFIINNFSEEYKEAISKAVQNVFQKIQKIIEQEDYKEKIIDFSVKIGGYHEDKNKDLKESRRAVEEYFEKKFQEKKDILYRVDFVLTKFDDDWQGKGGDSGNTFHFSSVLNGMPIKSISVGELGEEDVCRS